MKPLLLTKLMTEQQPITPPPELFAEWFANSLKTLDRKVSRDDTGTTGLIAGEVAIQAARWGADQELEACCEWLDENTGRWDLLAELRAARRKPPSLKEQALAALDDAILRGDCITTSDALPIIRRALEQLP